MIFYMEKENPELIFLDLTKKKLPTEIRNRFFKPVEKRIVPEHDIPTLDKLVLTIFDLLVQSSSKSLINCLDHVTHARGQKTNLPFG